MKICCDLDVIRTMAEDQHDENVEFRSFLVQLAIGEAHLDAVVRSIALEAMARIDCISCNNCCVVLTAQATGGEVRKMATSLGLSPAEFSARFVVPSVLADPVLGKQVGAHHRGDCCSLLKDGRCTVYAVRPRNCRAYPLILGRGFRTRIWGMVDNCRVCPIVSAVYTELKAVLRPGGPRGTVQ